MSMIYAFNFAHTPIIGTYLVTLSKSSIKIHLELYRFSHILLCLYMNKKSMGQVSFFKLPSFIKTIFTTGTLWVIMYRC